MRYLRCKCGEMEAWTSCGHPACAGCKKCGVTLAEGSQEHEPIAPHDWFVEWAVDKKTGERWQERRCLYCHEAERITA